MDFKIIEKNIYDVTTAVSKSGNHSIIFYTLYKSLPIGIEGYVS